MGANGASHNHRMLVIKCWSASMSWRSFGESHVGRWRSEKGRKSVGKRKRGDETVHVRGLGGSPKATNHELGVWHSARRAAGRQKCKKVRIVLLQWQIIALGVTRL